MKILKTSDITDSTSMPLKSGSLKFIQEAYKETNTQLVTQIIGYTPDNTKGYIIQGVATTIVGSNYTITSGAIYYNGELFPVIGSSFTLIGGQQVFGVISSILYTDADPVLFGDNIQRNVHENRVITFQSALSGDLLLSNTIKGGSWLTGDLKEIDCTNAYITANFDGTGLGINERKGWAICNGNNGTKNRNGRISLQYDPSNYPTMGAIGGSANAVVVSHSHTYDYVQNQNSPAGNVLQYDAIGGSGGADKITQTTSTTGVSGTNQNLQPYMVTLFIQKL